MSKRGDSAKLRAKSDAKTAGSVLSENGVRFFQTVVARQERVDGRLLWRLRNTSHMQVWSGDGDVGGRWYVDVDIAYDVDTLDGKEEVFVPKSSLGLSWEPEGAAAVASFVRYDVDLRKAASLTEPCHVNVLQVKPFDDHIHYRLPAAGIQKEWPLRSTLEFLCSPTLRDDIAARLR